jgi:hypothetical protein
MRLRTLGSLIFRHGLTAITGGSSSTACCIIARSTAYTVSVVGAASLREILATKAWTSDLVTADIRFLPRAGSKEDFQGLNPRSALQNFKSVWKDELSEGQWREMFTDAQTSELAIGKTLRGAAGNAFTLHSAEIGAEAAKLDDPETVAQLTRLTGIPSSPPRSTRSSPPAGSRWSRPHRRRLV